MSSRQKLPGYGGFVPYRSEIFGSTVGDANRQAAFIFNKANAVHQQNPYDLKLRKNAVNEGILHVSAGLQGNNGNGNNGRASSNFKKLDLTIDKHVLGNRSRSCCTWVNGPMHEVRTQHLPGYTGYIPTVKAENVIAQTYANSVNNAFDYRRSESANLPRRNLKEIYQTSTARQHDEGNFRRIKQDKAMQSRRDYMEYTLHMNKEQKNARDHFIRHAGKTQQNTQDFGKTISHIHPYEDHSGTTLDIAPRKRDLNCYDQSKCQADVTSAKTSIQVSPYVLENSKLARSQKFRELSPAFQKAVTGGDHKQALDQSMKLPVVGYCGHRKGIKAENLFAVNFRHQIMSSEKALRGTKSASTLLSF